MQPLKIKKNEQTSQKSFPNHPQNTVTKGNEDEARAAQNQKNYAQLQTVNHSIILRLMTAPSDVISLIFNKLNLILSLRSLNKAFYNLVTSFSGDFSLLSSRATISFKDEQIYPEIDEPIKEIFDFAKSNTHVEVKIPLERLLLEESILPSVPHNRLKLVIEIKNIRELNSLLEFLGNNTERKDQIIGLDLGKLEINKNTLPTIEKLFEKSDLISKLKKLSLGSFRNAQLNLPSLPKLSSLSFGPCYGKVSINAFYDFPELSTLSFGNIQCTSFELSLPKQFPNLKILSFGNIYVNTMIFSLPDFLTELKILFFGNLMMKELIMPKEFLNLEKATFGDITLLKPFTLPESPNLKHLSFGTLNRNTYNFPTALPELTQLSCTKISKEAKLNLPKSVPKLQDLHDDDGILRKRLNKNP